MKDTTRVAGGEAHATMSAEIPNYYVVRQASEEDAIRSLRALDALFARRVVVFVSKTPTVSSCGAMAPTCL